MKQFLIRWANRLGLFLWAFVTTQLAWIIYTSVPMVPIHPVCSKGGDTVVYRGNLSWVFAKQFRSDLGPVITRWRGDTLLAPIQFAYYDDDDMVLNGSSHAAEAVWAMLPKESRGMSPMRQIRASESSNTCDILIPWFTREIDLYDFGFVTTPPPAPVKPK